MNILFVNSSPRGGDSMSSKIARILIEKIEKQSTTAVKTRDLFSPEITNVNSGFISATYTPSENRGEDAIAALKLSDELISEIQNADGVVISSPFWNFSMPSVLKAYMDNIARVGVTFKYTDKGPVGLIDSSKKVTICIASGGVYSSSENSVLEANMKIFETFFKFLGFGSVDFLVIEGVAYGEDAIKAGLEKVEQKAEEVAKKWLNN